MRTAASAAGDQKINGSNAGIYQMPVNGSVAQVIGTVQLVGSQRTGPFVILGDADRILCDDTTDNVLRIYNYPAGGDAIKTLNVVPSGTLKGIAISQSPPP